MGAIEDIRIMILRTLFMLSYSDKIYEYAIELIKKGLAYVDDLDVDQIREYRGTIPTKDSPWRNRHKRKSRLFERMKNGN